MKVSPEYIILYICLIKEIFLLLSLSYGRKIRNEYMMKIIEAKNEKANQTKKTCLEYFISKYKYSKLVKKQFLSIYVRSSPIHKSHRYAIRRTWGAEAASLNINVTFFIGRNEMQDICDLRDEEKLYGDIAYLPHVIDSYDTLSLKTFEILAWHQRKCLLGECFLFWVNSDVLVSPKKLLQFIKTNAVFQPANNIYGYCTCRNFGFCKLPYQQRPER